MKILVTGANGFVGSAVVAEASFRGLQIIAATRSAHVFVSDNVQNFLLSELNEDTEWHDALCGCNAVISCAARVHVMNDFAIDPLAEFRKVNVSATLNLAQQAALYGVKRFVYISSVKVNGETTIKGLPFQVDALPEPKDAYSISKMEAEQGLREISAQTGMEIVIIRPPLVYGPDVKANFASMMQWLKRGIPLPFGAIHNQRSLVSLGNLVDLIIACLTHSAAANQTFMVSDGEDVSTTELLRRLGAAMGHPARLIPVPANWLKFAAGLVGKSDVAQRLCGSLQLDISRTRELLGWNPPFTLDQGLAQTAQGFK